MVILEPMGVSDRLDPKPKRLPAQPEQSQTMALRQLPRRDTHSVVRTLKHHEPESSRAHQGRQDSRFCPFYVQLRAKGPTSRRSGDLASGLSHFQNGSVASVATDKAGGSGVCAAHMHRQTVVAIEQPVPVNVTPRQARLRRTTLDAIAQCALRFIQMNIARAANHSRTHKADCAVVGADVEEHVSHTKQGRADAHDLGIRRTADHEHPTVVVARVRLDPQSAAQPRFDNPSVAARPLCDPSLRNRRQPTLQRRRADRHTHRPTNSRFHRSVSAQVPVTPAQAAC